MGFGETANHCFLQEKIPVILTAENLIFPDYLGLLTFNLTISAFIVWIKSCLGITDYYLKKKFCNSSFAVASGCIHKG